jgi:ADP-heptose:LPS heptosyltransferase
VIGGPDDRPRARAFSAALDEPALIAAGETSLPQAAALLGQCSLFVGTDSGPAHLAAGVGCPLVVLFGPGKVHVMRPFTDAAAIVASPQPCDPRCHNTVCFVPERHCLAAIGVQDVYAAADAMLAAARSRAARRVEGGGQPAGANTAP